MPQKYKKYHDFFPLQKITAPDKRPYLYSGYTFSYNRSFSQRYNIPFISFGFRFLK